MSQLHFVFNVERFKKSPGTPTHLIGRKIYQAADFLFDEAGQRVHIVNKLVKQRKHHGRREFLVDWLDEPASQQSWEPESNILAHWNGLLADLQRRPTAQTNPVARRDRQRQAPTRSSRYNLRSTSSGQASGVENVM
ncbi:hypothetical protein PHYSODRAFT_297387 [Phytophthora sojae]|uniref:Chromo domain-containing protein n=1 Tax=Phytophthora sojae (strain P6497) TaxID=1094619 RepID=G4Z1K6_PHYSP|nr:hypothetical protein PHYSODRAFT_297387 [Phytophthora sojae]EGZ25917.1 hypothetical protein PHYSODRAFT_297387 [Phytophthora sojae]|eukprot:XP_009521205.1 hypothetical protein PHYSODRAFT_297387 [Phytophthora sojae]